MQGPWCVAGLYEFTDDDALVLSELRIFPGQDRFDARSELEKADLPWPGVRGQAVAVPDGGIRAQLVREIRFSRLTGVAQRSLKEAIAGWDALFVKKAVTRRVRNRARLEASLRPGRLGRSDQYYLKWALRYVRKIGDESRTPILDLAREYGMRTSQVRDLLRKARERRLLTSTRGAAGGTLTDKARQLLSDQKERGLL
jgi:hypothetical protein